MRAVNNNLAYPTKPLLTAADNSLPLYSGTDFDCHQAAAQAQESARVPRPVRDQPQPRVGAKEQPQITGVLASEEQGC